MKQNSRFRRTETLNIVQVKKVTWHVLNLLVVSLKKHFYFKNLEKSETVEYGTKKNDTRKITQYIRDEFKELLRYYDLAYYCTKSENEEIDEE